MCLVCREAEAFKRKVRRHARVGMGDGNVRSGDCDESETVPESIAR
jgi:hypothetical protein